MTFKKRIFTPGPTEVPPQVLEALSRPLIHHRTDSFKTICKEIAEGLRYVFSTTEPVLVLTSSGTGALEAAVANLTMPGETVIVTPCGKFSERWHEIAKVYGMDAVRVEAEWGKAVKPEAVEKAFKKNPGAKVLFCTHCETSTGVLHDVKEFARIAHEHDALIAVDAITSLIAEEVETETWGLDAVVGGSQKGFMIPPGLSFISLSADARERVLRPGHPVYYFDLARALDSAVKGDTPYTPAISLFRALHSSLEMIKAEGLQNTQYRHQRNASAARDAVAALGLELFADIPCNATTAVLTPEGSAAKIIELMNTRFGVRVAGGQAHLKGKIIRLGHLGWYDETDMHTMIAALEGTLSHLGLNPYPGRGIEALLGSFGKK